MQFLRVCTVTLPRHLKTSAFGLCLPALMLTVAVAGAGLFSGHAQSPAPLPAAGSTASQAAVPTPADKPPLASTASTDPKQEIAQLLQMATDLKAEVDKTNKDQLSVAVVRKANALEQLARKVRNAWPASSH